MLFVINYIGLKILVVWSSKISRKLEILISRYSQIKDIISLVSYWFCNPSIVHIFGTKCPISMGFPAKCTVAFKWCTQSGRLYTTFIKTKNINISELLLSTLPISDNRIQIYQNRLFANMPVIGPGGGGDASTKKHVKGGLFFSATLGKSILQVPDTGTRVLDNTRPFWHSSIFCFWMPPACSKECK